MSRHSKWAKIKHQKGTADQKRAVVFTKLSRVVTIAARSGGDPASNFKLRLAIDQAKTAGMPKDTIERAIAKGSGASKEGVQMIEDTYEGFGPGGTVFMVEVITDNKNRAYQELRKEFSEYGGNIGNSGSVAWMFERRGVIRLAVDSSQSTVHSELELKLIDAGAEDLVFEDEGITIYTKPEELKAVEEKIRAAGFSPTYAGLSWVAKEKVVPEESVAEQLQGLEDALDNMEDASEYYSNVA